MAGYKRSLGGIVYTVLLYQTGKRSKALKIPKIYIPPNGTDINNWALVYYSRDGGGCMSSGIFPQDSSAIHAGKRAARRGNYSKCPPPNAIDLVGSCNCFIVLFVAEAETKKWSKKRSLEKY